MQFDYDKTTDSLYISLLSGGSVESEEVAQDVVLDFNAAGKVVGIDIQHASQHSDLRHLLVSGIAPTIELRSESV